MNWIEFKYLLGLTTCPKMYAKHKGVNNIVVKYRRDNNYCKVLKCFFWMTGTDIDSNLDCLTIVGIFFKKSLHPVWLHGKSVLNFDTKSQNLLVYRETDLIVHLVNESNLEQWRCQPSNDTSFWFTWMSIECNLCIRIQIRLICNTIASVGTIIIIIMALLLTSLFSMR